VPGVSTPVYTLSILIFSSSFAAWMRNAARLRRPKANMNESAKTGLDWHTIALPGNGVILQNIVEPDAFVVPQSFTGNRRLASR
jgi:hypothetical protein